MNTTQDAYDKLAAKDISINFKLLLDNLWSRAYDTPVLISKELAILLSGHDPDELYIHIEWPDARNNNRHPALWHISGWKECYKKWLDDKEFSEIDRRYALIVREVIERIVKQMCHRTSSSLADMNRIAATTMVVNKAWDMIRFYSVNTDELRAVAKERGECLAKRARAKRCSFVTPKRENVEL